MQVRGNSVEILACIKNAILVFSYEEFEKFQGFKGTLFISLWDEALRGILMQAKSLMVARL